MESLLVLVLSVSIVSVVTSETFQHGNVADTHSGKSLFDKKNDFETRKLFLYYM